MGGRKKAVGRAWRRGEAYVGVQALLFGLIAGGPWMDNPRRGMVSGWMLALSGLTLTAGGLGSLWALFQLGRNLSVLPHPKAGAALVRSGAYAWVRHPIYVFVLALGAGWALLWRSSQAGLAWAALGLLFDLKARREERLLAERFPDYDAYRRRVRRFIPGLY